MAWAKIPALAKHLGLSVRTTRELIKSGIIPATKLPSGTIISNKPLVDQTLKDLGQESEKKDETIINEILGGLK